MSANRWYKDSTLARDCQGCTSKIHALAIACRKIPHTIGNKAAAREIPARPVTPHPSRKASGFPQARCEKGPRSRGTRPNQRGGNFSQAQRGRRLPPALSPHPSRRGCVSRRRNAKEGLGPGTQPKPEGRQFSEGATRKKVPVRAPHPSRKGGGFRRHDAKKGPRSRGARPNQKAGNFPQARRRKRPCFARIPKRKRLERRDFRRRNAEQASAREPHPNRKDGGFPQARRGGRPPPGPQAGRAVVSAGTTRKKAPPLARRPPKPEGRQFSAGTSQKKTLLCSHSKKKAPGKARFPQGRFERKPRLPWDPPPNQKGGNFPQAQRGRRLPPALSPPPKPEGRRLCRACGLSPPAPAGSGPRRPGCWRGSRRWRPP